MTLVELSLAIGLLGVVVVGVLATMNSAQLNVDKQIARSDSNDQLRQAFESIDREVRSGNVLYDPSTENYSTGDIAPGMSLRIYTQTNAPTRGGHAWCVQWRITSARQLQMRRWTPYWTDATDPDQVGSWHTIATGLTNRTESIAAFARATGAGNLLTVRLRTNSDPNGKKGSVVEVQDSVSGRNTQFYPATTNCGPQTADPGQTNPKDGTKVPPY